MKIFDIFNKQVEVQKDNNSPNKYIAEQQKYRTFETLETLEAAIAEAENIDSPQRYLLNRIYDQIELDPHLSSQWENRKMKTIGREWSIMTGETEDEKTKDLLDSEWFHEFMHLALDSKKRGFNLITFGRWDGNTFTWTRGSDGKVYDPVRIVNHDHVIPEKGLLTKNIYDQTGRDFFKPPFSNNTLFVGSPKSFGYLRKCAKYILFKDNCLSNWSEFAEVFGQDMRIGKTSAKGAARNNFIKMLQKLGSGGFGLMDEDDEIIFAGTSRTDAYQVYKELNEYVDKNVSKVIFGQDVISDMTGVTKGTAAENVTDTYAEHDAKYLKGVINDRLFPKLIDMGLTFLSGKVFDWQTSEDVGLTERSEIDLRISQMGVKFDPDYIEQTYGVKIDESTPEKVSEEIKNLYRGTV